MNGIHVLTALPRRISLACHWLDQVELEESLSELPDDDLAGRCRVMNHVRSVIRQRLQRVDE